jgi:hypothetical protein
MSNNNMSINEEQLAIQIEIKSDNTTSVETKPAQNVWKKRSEEASKIQKPIEPNAPSVDTGKGYGRGYGLGKGSGKGYNNDGKGFGKGKGYNDGKGKGYNDGKGKGFRIQREMKELTPEEKQLIDEKNKVLFLAQDIALKKCVDICNPKIREEINGSISYEMNYRRTLVMDISEDEIVVEVDDKKRVYSLIHFLRNKTFENKLRDEYIKILPDAWIRLSEGRDEGTYCIKIQKRKN